MGPIDQAIALVMQVLRLLFELIINILRLIVGFAESVFSVFF